MWLTPDYSGGTNQLVVVPDERVEEYRRRGLPLKQVVDDIEVEKALKAYDLADAAVLRWMVERATSQEAWDAYDRKEAFLTPLEQVLKKFGGLVDESEFWAAYDAAVVKRERQALAKHNREGMLKAEFRPPVKPKRMKRVMMPVGDAISGYTLQEVEVPE